jgi:parallel beta-helix repeat protein
MSSDSNNTQITGNTASNNQSDGILVEYDVNPTGQSDSVVGNTVNSNANTGVFSLLSTYVTVSNNIANSNAFGIVIQNSAEARTYDTVKSNTTDNNNDGIVLVYDDQTSISLNTSESNMYDGLVFLGSGASVVSDNTANENRENGIALFSSSNNAIAGNAASNNTQDGIDLDQNSVTNTLIGNAATKNGKFDLEDDSTGSGTGGTANTWSGNRYGTKDPSGLD